MDRTQPLLNPEQLEELNLMVNSISQENSQSLEELLNQQMLIEHATIMRILTFIQNSIMPQSRSGPKNKRSSTTSATFHVPHALFSHHDVHCRVSLESEE